MEGHAPGPLSNAGGSCLLLSTRDLLFKLLPATAVFGAGNSAYSSVTTFQNFAALPPMPAV